MSIQRNRWHAKTLLAVVTCMILAGCDGDSTDPLPTTPPTPITPTATTTPVTESTLTPAPVESTDLGQTPNVHQVGKIITAGQPTREAFTSARDTGYRVVLDLRSEQEDRGFDERAVVEELGMEYINPGFRSPDSLTDDIFDRSRAVLKASEKTPVLMHCASANRVGGVWLTYRVLDEGVPLEKAMEEAATIGLSNEGILNKAKDYIEGKRAE